ncbi:F0F1 ATP synthase subunit delta [Brachybacterium sp. YJGR34]|uniref:F0F1 ATP synthase subunit delta n=1 Tax=Brachybacterium sp. YJGR34 TaxID=2059911 RepID=UPI000E0A0D21|nr:F0F1 ATP synthase subunit delta [Brachybacterium sp. YJGR34]
MRGTSSTSFGEVLQQAEGAFSAQSGTQESTAEELFSTADAVDASNQLVRVLSDPGRPAAVKEDTVRSLFGAQVSPAALEITLDVVRHRWSEQEDILDALELLGVSALLSRAQADGVLEQVERELFEISRMIDDSGDLTIALDGSREDPSQRATLLRRLLDGRAHSITVALAARAVGRRTGIKPARRIEEFARFASDRRRLAFASVASAVALDETQQSRLAAVLAGIYGREIQMILHVDPDVVGGLRIQVGDDLYDATVLARLTRARQRLVA